VAPTADEIFFLGKQQRRWKVAPAEMGLHVVGEKKLARY